MSNVKNYESPMLEVIEVKVENGFALSDGKGNQNEDYDFDQW